LLGSNQLFCNSFCQTITTAFSTTAFAVAFVASGIPRAAISD
jgi:hypothetical protein